MVGGGRRGGGCAPGRVVGGANAKGGGGRGADMDKLKKVLSGQDTEDRSGLSEVSARGSWHFLERRPALLQPAAPNSAGTQPQWQRGLFVEGVAPEPSPTFPPKGLRF